MCDALRRETQIAALAAELPIGQRSRSEFSVVAAVREVYSWSVSAPSDAWARRANAQSLATDVSATLATVGSRFRTFFEAARGDVVTALERSAVASTKKRPEVLDDLRCVARSALDQLASPAARSAAWEDLVDAAQDPLPSLSVIHASTTLLQALFEEAAINPQAVFSQIQARLDPSCVGLADSPEHETFDIPLGERLRAASAIVASPAELANCVAWLSLREARLPTAGVGTTIGPVTFYESDWAIPNALDPGGHDFPHRVELNKLCSNDHLWAAREDTQCRNYEVLARLDLGYRPTYRALDDATATVQQLIGVVAARSGAPAWRLTGSSWLLVEGEVRRVTVGLDAPVLASEPDHYGQNGFADALGDFREDLESLAALGPLPALFAEALRIIGEAAQVDSRENSLNRSARIAEQTVIVLQESAAEHLAAVAEMSIDDHARALLTAWPVARYKQEVVRVIQECLRGRGGTDPLYLQVVSHTAGRTHYSLIKAFELRDELLPLCSGEFYRARSQLFLDSLGDWTSAAYLLEQFADEAQRLHSRLRRSRNALVHGNPVSVETVRSVRPLCRFKVDSGLAFAIRGAVEGRPSTDILLESAAEHLRLVSRVRSGQTLHHIWSEAAVHQTPSSS